MLGIGVLSGWDDSWMLFPFSGEKRNTQGCQTTYVSVLQNGPELEDQMLIAVLPVLLLSPGSLGLCCSLASAFLTFWSISAVQKKPYAPSHRLGSVGRPLPPVEQLAHSSVGSGRPTW